MEELEDNELERRGGQMSFLEHLDELRKRLVNSVVIIVVAFMFCWFVSGHIYEFLEVPIRRALSEAERRDLPIKGLTGDEKVMPLTSLREGDHGRFVFDQATKLGASVVQPGTSVESAVTRDGDGVVGLFTEEPIYTINAVIPKGVRLPVDLTGASTEMT